MMTMVMITISKEEFIDAVSEVGEQHGHVTPDLVR